MNRMDIIIPIGISGSGKSRLYKMRYKDMTIVSPDEIRKELTGNISDQSRNKEVFEIVDKRVSELVKKGESFFYDATNINTSLRRKFVNQFINSDVNITYIVLPADVNISNKRIQKDMNDKVDRSKVPYQVLLNQYAKYQESIQTNFEGENVQKIIWIKPGELD